jgi:hypothetical protein
MLIGELSRTRWLALPGSELQMRIITRQERDRGGGLG